MTPDKRKQQYKKATAKNKAKKEAAGFKRVYFWIKPEWKAAIKELIKNKMTEKCQKKGVTENDNSK